MSIFVEVESVEKNCKVIINLEHINEIAPLTSGGCAIFFNDSAAVNGVRSMKVKDNYSQFKQFVMQTVTTDMINQRIERIQESSGVEKKESAIKRKVPSKETSVESPEFVIPKL